MLDQFASVTQEFLQTTLTSQHVSHSRRAVFELEVGWKCQNVWRLHRVRLRAARSKPQRRANQSCRSTCRRTDRAGADNVQVVVGSGDDEISFYSFSEEKKDEICSGQNDLAALDW